MYPSFCVSLPVFCPIDAGTMQFLQGQDKDVSDGHEGSSVFFDTGFTGCVTENEQWVVYAGKEVFHPLVVVVEGMFRGKLVICRDDEAIRICFHCMPL